MNTVSLILLMLLSAALTSADKRTEESNQRVIGHRFLNKLPKYDSTSRRRNMRTTVTFHDNVHANDKHPNDGTLFPPHIVITLVADGDTNSDER